MSAASAYGGLGVGHGDAIGSGSGSGQKGLAGAAAHKDDEQGGAAGVVICTRPQLRLLLAPWKAAAARRRLLSACFDALARQCPLRSGSQYQGRVRSASVTTAPRRTSAAVSGGARAADGHPQEPRPKMSAVVSRAQRAAEEMARGNYKIGVAFQNLAGYPAVERDQRQGGRLVVQQEIGKHADVARSRRAR